jgi:hypothetical protein
MHDRRIAPSLSDIPNLLCTWDSKESPKAFRLSNFSLSFSVYNNKDTVNMNLCQGKSEINLHL